MKLLQEINKTLDEIQKTIPFPGLNATNADAVASHLEEGLDNGGLDREALARWLRSLAVQLRSFEEIMK